MASLTITRGLPGCGKTTYARDWVAEDPTRRARVNRDDLGAQLHGRRFYDQPDLLNSTERAITAAQHAQIRALLDRGLDIICDDTNLVRRTARDLRRLATLASADFAIVDFLDIPLDVVLTRNAQRTDTPAFVPEQVIREKAAKHGGRNAYEVPLADEPDDAVAALPYVPAADAPSAVMVDIDGTVALMVGRSPYDENRVHEDRANHAVISAVRAMHAAGHAVVFCSGRTAACRDATEKWLAEHVAVPYEALHMRAVGDMRRDSVVKLEIFDREIRDRWHVVAVFDDRRQVVEAWRSIGLTVFQVAPGDF
jgi:tRNA uridine 5-carbamoylmethylation protein Kti12